MTIKTAALAILSVVLATGGQLLLRAGMEKVGYIGAPQISRPFKLLITVATNIQVVIGLSLFVASAVAWLVVLSRASLSVAYPFAGMTYVFTALFSKFILHEKVPSIRWFGILMVLTGILIVGRSAPPEIH